MRQQHDMLHRDQLGRHARLVLEHVEAGGQDLLVAQRRDQRGFVDDAAAADVDDDAVRPQRFQHLAVDDVPRLGAARGHDHQHVAALRQAQQRRVVAVGHLRLRLAAVVFDLQLAGFQPLGDGLADAPQAEDADLAAAQRRRQRIGPLEPLAGAQVAVHLRQLAHGGDQQAQREVGDLAGQHVGRVRDDDAAPGQRGGIDMVVADTEAGDDLEPREQLDEVRVDARVAAEHGHAAHLEAGLAHDVEVLGQLRVDRRRRIADRTDDGLGLAHAMGPRG